MKFASIIVALVAATMVNATSLTSRGHGGHRHHENGWTPDLAQVAERGSHCMELTP